MVLVSFSNVDIYEVEAIAAIDMETKSPSIFVIQHFKINDVSVYYQIKI
jgi:hypothetical protein